MSSLMKKILGCAALALLVNGAFYFDLPNLMKTSVITDGTNAGEKVYTEGFSDLSLVPSQPGPTPDLDETEIVGSKLQRLSTNTNPVAPELLGPITAAHSFQNFTANLSDENPSHGVRFQFLSSAAQTTVQKRVVATPISDMVFRAVGDTVYYAWIQSSGITSQIFTAQLDLVTNAFSTPVSLTNTLTNKLELQMQIDGGEIYYVWKEKSISDVSHYFLGKTDLNGAWISGFSNGIQMTHRIVTSNIERTGLQFQVAAGAIYFVWTERDISLGTPWKVFRAKTDLDGSGWEDYEQAPASVSYDQTQPKIQVITTGTYTGVYYSWGEIPNGFQWWTWWTKTDLATIGSTNFNNNKHFMINSTPSGETYDFKSMNIVPDAGIEQMYFSWIRVGSGASQIQTEYTDITFSNTFHYLPMTSAGAFDQTDLNVSFANGSLYYIWQTYDGTNHKILTTNVNLTTLALSPFSVRTSSPVNKFNPQIQYDGTRLLASWITAPAPAQFDLWAGNLYSTTTDVLIPDSLITNNSVGFKNTLVPNLPISVDLSALGTGSLYVKVMFEDSAPGSASLDNFVINYKDSAPTPPPAPIPSVVISPLYGSSKADARLPGFSGIVTTEQLLEIEKNGLEPKIVCDEKGRLLRIIPGKIPMNERGQISKQSVSRGEVARKSIQKSPISRGVGTRDVIEVSDEATHFRTTTEGVARQEAAEKAVGCDFISTKGLLKPVEEFVQETQQEVLRPSANEPVLFEPVEKVVPKSLDDVRVLAQTSEIIDTKKGGTLNVGNEMENATVVFAPQAIPGNSEVVSTASQLDISQVNEVAPPTAGQINMGAYKFEVEKLDESVSNSTEDGTEQKPVPEKITRFQKPIKITISYDPEKTREIKAGSMTVGYWDGKKWAAVEASTIDTASHTVSFETLHFSVFSVLGEFVSSVTDSEYFKYKSEVDPNGLNYEEMLRQTKEYSTDSSFKSVAQKKAETAASQGLESFQDIEQKYGYIGNTLKAQVTGEKFYVQKKGAVPRASFIRRPSTQSSTKTETSTVRIKVAPPQHFSQ